VGLKIQFVNHSSYVIDSCGVRLLCDPWIEGQVFDDGWALLSPTRFSYEDFGGITHIWFSHEHPDHFNPPNLRRIAPEHRRRITVLFQATRDHRVIDVCRKLGFGAVRELEPGRREDLAPGFSIRCDPVEGFDDSWLLVNTPAGNILNINDCAVFEREEARRIKQSVGHVDVLSTQFSVSAWDGNPEAVGRRRAGARTMLERAVMHCEEFAPRFVIPFASFIWFCHEENAYMNDAFLGIDEVERTLRTRSSAQPIVMYPGDEWRVGTSHDSCSAVARYLDDQSSIATRALSRSKSAHPDELIAASRRFCREVLDGSNPLRLRLGRSRRAFRDARPRSPSGVRSMSKRFADLVLLRVAKARIYVSDHHQSYVLSLDAGLQLASFEQRECDVAVSTGALLYAFKFLWGGQTLQINGRFREIRLASRQPLFEIFAVAGWRKSGNTVRWSSTPRHAVQIVKRALLTALLYGSQIMSI
jgi:L-ascorbate metabolism protein UlaG (beta-lactamase superfamily)